jgi:hypothetical protein
MDTSGTADDTPDDAHFELSFSPNVRLVAPVRRFVSEFYARALGDPEVSSQLAVATHELLDNTVRYSVDGNTTIRIGIQREGGELHVTIHTRNRAPSGHIEALRQILDELRATDDPDQHYQVMMRRSVQRKEGSGLGLGRIHAETGMNVEYRIDGDEVHLTAHAAFAAKEVT